MNLNDINKRLERIYLSIDESIDKELKKSLEVVIDPETKEPLGVKLDPQAKADTEHRILTIIHNIASLKDHLKREYSNVEDEINNCIELQLVIDIDNSDKHGYPAKIRPRSNLFPKIINIDRVVKVQKSDIWEYKEEVKFDFNPETNNIIQKRTFTIGVMNGSIIIDADIVNEKGEFIMKFNDLITNSLNKWEEIIKIKDFK